MTIIGTILFVIVGAFGLVCLLSALELDDSDQVMLAFSIGCVLVVASLLGLYGIGTLTYVLANVL